MGHPMEWKCAFKILRLRLLVGRSFHKLPLFTQQWMGTQLFSELKKINAPSKGSGQLHHWFSKSLLHMSIGNWNPVPTFVQEPWFMSQTLTVWSAEALNAYSPRLSISTQNTAAWCPKMLSKICSNHLEQNHCSIKCGRINYNWWTLSDFG